MDDLLEDLAGGRITLDKAKKEMWKRLYIQGVSNLDFGREGRTGIPEIIIAEGKTDEHLHDTAASALESGNRALISRIDEGTKDNLLGSLEGELKEKYDPEARFLILRKEGFTVPEIRGKVGFITAGTSDIPVSREGEIIAMEMGCEVRSFYDIGVAGIHRIVEPLRDLSDWGADVLVVAAGREGALPTVISGLVPVPVIGLPVSTGYGIHGKGEAALFAMLQSCSPICVVNIDAGLIAGAVAARIARGSGRT